MVPTWKNGRKGEHHIGKRLDTFFIKESILAKFNFHKSWVVNTAILDHFSVVLELSSRHPKIKYPFKFNPVWLGNSSFDDLVRKFWTQCQVDIALNPMNRLVTKLRLLKAEVKIWGKRQK